MHEKIKIQKLGKMRIYLPSGETIKSAGLLRKMFPKNMYGKILEEAKNEGLLNAHVFHTQSAYKKGDRIHHRMVEGDNSGLTVCIELVDEKEKLQKFFLQHEKLLKGKTVIFKEVEYWNY